MNEQLKQKIEAIAFERFVGDSNWQTGFDMDDYRDALTKGAELAQEWISVDDEKPPIRKDTLFAYTNAMRSCHLGYFVGFFSEGKYYESGTEERWKNALFPIYTWRSIETPLPPKPGE